MHLTRVERLLDDKLVVEDYLPLLVEWETAEGSWGGSPLYLFLGDMIGSFLEFRVSPHNGVLRSMTLPMCREVELYESPSDMAHPAISESALGVPVLDLKAWTIPGVKRVDDTQPFHAQVYQDLMVITLFGGPHDRRVTAGRVDFLCNRDEVVQIDVRLDQATREHLISALGI